MSDRNSFIQSLTGYTSGFAQEDAFRRQFLDLLKHPRAFFRDHLPGHITASAWIIDKTGQYALLTHHAKLDRWLQPGGHADGQEDVLAVSQREAYEETGLTSLQPRDASIFDLDIHPIPARADFPAHLHYDVRFLFVANMEESFTITNESHDLAWISSQNLAEKTGHNVSILRMAEKVKQSI